MAKTKNLNYLLNDEGQIYCNDKKFRPVVIHNDKKKSIKFYKQTWRFDKITMHELKLKKWKIVSVYPGDIVHSNGDVRRKSGEFEPHGRPIKKVNIGLHIEKGMV